MGNPSCGRREESDNGELTVLETPAHPSRPERTSEKTQSGKDNVSAKRTKDGGFGSAFYKVAISFLENLLQIVLTYFICSHVQHDWNHPHWNHNTQYHYTYKHTQYNTYYYHTISQYELQPRGTGTRRSCKSNLLCSVSL